MVDAISAWSEFHVAMVGAAATLAGLVIVAASVNIAAVVKAPSLTSRLAAGITNLVLPLVVSAVGLIPELDAAAFGITAIVAALLASVFQTVAARRIFENRHPDNRLRTLKAAVGFAAPAAYVLGGVLLLLTGSSAGLLAFAIGSILAIAAALLVSWVALVEVLR
jgi:hypothetical protein